jgi:hypothetical protein
LLFCVVAQDVAPRKTTMIAAIAGTGANADVGITILNLAKAKHGNG